MSDDEGKRAGVSRRDLLRTGAAAGVAAAVGGATATPARARGNPGPGAGRPSPAGSVAVALVNGRIHTMDARGSVASDVLVEDGRFAALGGRVDTRGPSVRVIDLDGRTVVPGIIDNHNHIVLRGNRPGHHTPLENAGSIAEVQATFSGRAAGVPRGEFITTIGGFHSNQFAERRLPTVAELDAAVPDHPAYISIAFSGPSTTNTLGKQFFERAALPSTVGDDGSIAIGAQTGRATLTPRQTLTFEQRKRGAVEALAYGASLGVTTHLDQGAFQASNTPADGSAHEDNFAMHLPFLAADAKGKARVRLRINFLHMDAEESLPTLTERLRNAFPFFGDDLVRTGGIGEFTALGLGPNWLEANRRVARAGWRSEVHSLTPTDFQTEIAGFEAVNAEFPIGDPRWVVAHVPFITQEWVQRRKAIGGGLSLTGWRYLAGTGSNAGPPFRLIADSGINAGMSSDGWFLREEDKLGSIEPGKLADLVVLNDDYFSVPDERLKRLRSILTLVGGTVVHDSGELGGRKGR